MRKKTKDKIDGNRKSVEFKSSDLIGELDEIKKSSESRRLKQLC